MTRVCPSCGYDDIPEQVDWCPRCNEFLAWDRNGEQAPAADSAETGETATLAGPARTAVKAAPAAGRVVLRLRGPDDDNPTDRPVGISVEPGQTATLGALVRNESEVVEHFEITVEGLPGGWWSVDHGLVRLLPFGSGEYETDLTISIHPPRTAQARVGPREFRVVATAVAQDLEQRADAWVDVLPFRVLEVTARPPVAYGRRRARFFADVRNVGNAPVAVDVEASELEDRCSFVPPAVSTGIVPGETTAIPIVVRPRKPLIIGRTADRHLDLRAVTVDTEPGPVASASAIFRQRPWIPWWAALLVLLLVLIAVLLFLLWPRSETVPDVRGLPSAFAAQERLEEEGLTASPDSKTEVRPDVKPGTVIGQTPAPGTEVDPGSMVTLLLARGGRGTRVPDVKGLTPSEADQRLVSAHLTLGKVAPKLDPKGTIASQVPIAGRRRMRGTPVNVILAGTKVKVPDLSDLKVAKAEETLAKVGLKLGEQNPQPNPNRPIVSQVPAPDAQRPAGTAVDVFLKRPKPKKKKDQAKKSANASAVPSTSGQAAAAAAAAVQAAGLQPRMELAIHAAAEGTVVRTVPAAGDPPPSDGLVRIVVSAGFPRLAYDAGADLVTADGAVGGATAAVLPRRTAETKPSWIPGGRAVVARSEGGLVVASTRRPGRPARLELSRAGHDLDEPSVAQGTRGTVLAFVSHEPELGDRLCFSRLSGSAASRPSCRRLAGWRLGELTWMPNGRTLLAAAEPLDAADWRFGLLRLRTRTPFSTRAGAWRGGRSLVTPSQPRKGVAGVAVDPSGRRLALVTSHATSRFQIAIVAPDDLALRHARLLPLQGCDVEWRPDGAELAVVQSDNACVQPRGRIVRVAPSRPRDLRTVVLHGRDPAWQPVELGPVSPARASDLGTRP
jgi:beta-lactam-binding protein with PASTA domain